jgi:hypothetical protein
MTDAFNRRKGYQWGLHDRIEDLDFADDTHTGAEF